MTGTPFQQKAGGPGPPPQAGEEPLVFEGDVVNPHSFETENYLVLAADITTTAAGLATTPVVFTIPVLPRGLYLMEFFLFITTAGATIGYTLYLDGPASPTSLAYRFRGQTSTTTASEDVGYFNTYQTGYSSGFAGANTGVSPAMGWVLLNNGPNGGNVVLVIRSELSGSAVTCVAESICRYRRLR